jgi:hypothetical protein
VIFSFERGDLPIFVGQQMDVFIKGAAHLSSAFQKSADKLTNNESRFYDPRSSRH